MKDLRNRLIKKASIIAAIIACISVFIKREFSLGIVLGAAVSIFNLLLLERQVKNILSKQGMSFVGFFGYIVRYLLMGIALFASIKYDLYMFFGCAVGLFTVRIAIYFEARRPLERNDLS